MLIDHYERDSVFLSTLKNLAIKIDPELMEIDHILSDDTLFNLIKGDLSKRHRLTLKTGRNSTPIEVILRMLAVKQLYNLSYEETEKRVKDSLSLRWFCRVYFKRVCDHSTLIKWANVIRAETLKAFNERVTVIATEVKVTKGRKLRTDGTVVETNVHYPTDSSLLKDGVKLLSRVFKKVRQNFTEIAQEVPQLFRDRFRSARKFARRIEQSASSKAKAAKEKLKACYSKLVEVGEASVEQGQEMLSIIKEQSQQKAQELGQELQTLLGQMNQVLHQTTQRVFKGVYLPAQEKLVSFFEPHTDIIKRGKAHKETEFGHKVWLDEVDGGIVSNWRVLKGNPSDDAQWKPSIDKHIELFARPPNQASADRGVSSKDNEDWAKEKGVNRVILAQRGNKSPERKAYEKQGWFKRGRHFHAGIEGRISVLKRKHGLDRCLNKYR